MPIRWAYLKRVLAGAIFGLYMAHLLYFLNPQVDITPGRLATVTIVYGLTCGLLFGTALYGLRLLRVRMMGTPETARAHGFGFVVFAAFMAVVIYWIHLETVRDYLPIGAIRVMSKATNLITGVAFVLLLLWVLERNADRRTSRTLFFLGVALIAISSFFLYQRRESYRTETRNVVVANVGTVAGQRPVILVAIRNLPYDWIVTLGGEGLLPFFEQARASAYVARVEPFPTTSPKSLWASLATGKLPYRHGVTGRFSYRTPLNFADPNERFLMLPNGVGFRAWGLIPPVQRIEAQLPSGDALPVWTMFERLSFRSAVIGWPSSTGTSASRVVTDRDVRSVPRPRSPELERIAQRFNGAGQARPRVVEAMAADLASVEIFRGAVAQHAHELEVLALEGFAEAQRALHVGTNELPPRGSVKGEGVRAYAAQLDRMIGALARDYPDHVLIVVSPNAIVPPALPATAYALATRALTPDDPGADDGFVLVAGPPSANTQRAPTAYVVDIVPTVLFAAGLPVARDLDGRVLTEAFGEEFLRANPLSVIQTYEAKQMVVRRRPS